MRSLVLPLLLLNGCSTIPATTLTYYPTRAITTVRITHALSCTDDKSKFTVVSSGSTATTTSADTTSKPFTLNTGDFGNSTGSAKMTATFKEDGRLTGFNTESTGAGGEILKTILSLIPGAKAQDEGPDVVSLCTKVAKYGDKNTISYSEIATITSPEFGTPKGVKIEQFNFDTAGKILMEQISPEERNLPRSKLDVEVNQIRQLPPMNNNSAPVGSLQLRGIQQVDLKVEVTTFGKKEAAYKTTVVLPSTSEVFVPISTPKLFGSSEFELALSDIGSITTLHYGAKDATTSGLGAMASIIQATRSPTLAQETARMNDESDNIAAATRLAFCKTHPTECK